MGTQSFRGVEPLTTHLHLVPSFKKVQSYNCTPPLGLYISFQGKRHYLDPCEIVYFCDPIQQSQNPSTKERNSVLLRISVQIDPAICVVLLKNRETEGPVLQNVTAFFQSRCTKKTISVHKKSTCLDVTLLCTERSQLPPVIDALLNNWRTKCVFQVCWPRKNPSSSFS